jgi:hypothetical protein
MMNILIFDAAGNLARYIPAGSIACIKWIEQGNCGGFEILNQADTLIAVGNSARKLSHALISRLEHVCLNADEMLMPALFSRWCETVETASIGYLPEARMPMIGGAA